MTEQDDLVVVADAEVLTASDSAEEQSGALTLLEASEEAEPAEFSDNDQMLVGIFDLHTEDDMTPKKLAELMKGSFNNYSFDENEDMSNSFSDIDSLVDYIKRGIKDIRDRQATNEYRHCTMEACALTRFWDLCKTVSDNVKNRKYGNNVVQQLSDKSGLSKSYIYQMLLVSKNITRQEVYLLGIRAVGSRYLRNIAKIKDDDTRHAVIRDFCETYRSSGHLMERDEAKRKLLLAIKLGSGKEIGFSGDLTAANPGGVAEAESANTPEYDNIMAAMKSLKGMIDRLAKPEAMDNFRQYTSNYFMMVTSPDAENKHNRVKEHAEELKALCNKALENITTAIQELDSVIISEVLEPEK